MEIKEIKKDKRRFLPLLLLADEQENMIDNYLERGRLFVLKDDGIKSLCVITNEGSGILEIKNLITVPNFQRKGYGKQLIEYLIVTFRNNYSILQVGTGDSPLTIPFYEKCGFVRSHKVERFFTDNYDHPIYEGGVLLTDMIYLRRNL